MVVLILALLAQSPAPAAATPPAVTAAAADRRNVEVPDTDTHMVLADFATKDAWEAHRARVRLQILTAAGLDPMPEKTPLHPQRFGKLERDGYTIEKVLLETWPGFFLGGNLYVPTTPGKHPAVVSPHGHWNYGRLEHQPLASIPLRAANLARRGHVVFIYDMVGYNDTIQVPHSFNGRRETLWAFSPLGLQLWDSIRVVDYIASLPEVDDTRIGATGASGGGTQTFLLAAVDDRIAYAAPVNMVSAYMQGGSYCENAPGLRLGISNLDIAATLAPKPMLLISATGDWTKHVPQEEYPAIKRIYDLYGAGEKLTEHQVDAPHNYNQETREHVYRFLDQQAFGRTDDGKEKSAPIEKLGDMLALMNHPLPAHALNYDGLLADWQRVARAQADATEDLVVLRARFARVLAVPSLAHVSRDWMGVISRGDGDRILSAWTPGKGRPLVVVHPDGVPAGLALPEVEAARKAKRPLLVLGVFQTGSSVAPRKRTHNHWLTFNVSDDQARVHDIAASLAWLKVDGGADVLATGAARYWAAVAVAATGGSHALAFDVNALSGDDQVLEEQCFIPALQRAGGLRTVQRLVARSDSWPRSSSGQGSLR
ncbi:putative dienelactone hydrolase [Luteitalea pratensis]|uniref:Putative dienelactone hydrolase n=1 Tax=Luteitalea pratensis TaxID=1855912 RepID=A0A143PNX9_LUTPR|nr:acetylxylan esterase [Luteitalea pratensis]AMY10106.1 putative dienelactone hydrolase [Luteitalea pratensis]